MSDKLNKKFRKETRKVLGEVGEGTRAMFEQASKLPVLRRTYLAIKLFLGCKDWSREDKIAPDLIAALVVAFIFAAITVYWALG